jgi:hypothetical protein
MARRSRGNLHKVRSAEGDHSTLTAIHSKCNDISRLQEISWLPENLCTSITRCKLTCKCNGYRAINPVQSATYRGSGEEAEPPASLFWADGDTVA